LGKRQVEEAGGTISINNGKSAFHRWRWRTVEEGAADINTAKVEPGAKCVVFGLGGIGLNVIQGLRLVGADMIIGVYLNPDKKAWGERFGMTHFVNPNEVGGDLVAHLVNMTKSGADQIGGADYTFECVGNVRLMRAALESCHRGWGESIIIGVAGSGQEAAVSARDRPGMARAPLSAARAAAPTCQRSSTGTCREKFRSTR
jgi:threonine dehydrogenase-like Zn-dependent dehydrogenase